MEPSRTLIVLVLARLMSASCFRKPPTSVSLFVAGGTNPSRAARQLLEVAQDVGGPVGGGAADPGLGRQRGHRESAVAACRCALGQSLQGRPKSVLRGWAHFAFGVHGSSNGRMIASISATLSFRARLWWADRSLRRR